MSLFSGSRGNSRSLDLTQELEGLKGPRIGMLIASPSFLPRALGYADQRD
jgi:hypothetical protein